MAGKLTEEQKQEIVRRYEAGESSGEIARDYPVRPLAILRCLAKMGCDRRQGKEAGDGRLETLEKAGEQIGARFGEYWEIMQEWQT